MTQIFERSPIFIIMLINVIMLIIAGLIGFCAGTLVREYILSKEINRLNDRWCDLCHRINDEWFNRLNDLLRMIKEREDDD